MPARTSNSIIKDSVAFTSDGQLLAELGERLMSTPQVALAELIKNAYDADATRVHVWLSGSNLNIWDNGHGMNRDDFLAGWMVIASPFKLSRKVSPEHKRPLTGSKGVGRFAVRFLGRSLKLETVGRDKESNSLSRLTADFDWEALAAAAELDKAEIPYEVDFGSSHEKQGTLLQIGKLQEEWDTEKVEAVSRHLLDIVSPQAFSWLVDELRPKGDPGLRVYFGPPGTEDEASEAGSEVLDRWVGRVRISVRREQVNLRYQFGDHARTFSFRLRENLIGRTSGEIRYFPKRPGVFRGLSTIDGRNARSWVTDNSGVRVLDRGFRMPPYGEKDDDWLNLSGSKAARERAWGAAFTEDLYPVAKRDKRETSDPLLKIPANHQLIGAVAVNSYRQPRRLVKRIELRRSSRRRLQPAMDRQGFVENEGFRQLQEIVRASVELFAVIDVEETEKRKKREIQRHRKDLARRFQSAVEEVRLKPGLSPAIKRELIETYEDFASQVDRLQESHEEAQAAVESMSLLGVLSFFMTHEVAEMMRSVEEMLRHWESVPAPLRGIQYEKAREATVQARRSLKRHIDYAKTFVGAVRKDTNKPFKARPQVSLIVRQIENLARQRDISIKNDVTPDALAPAVGVAVYSGTLLNLLTNAIKAVITRAAGAGGTISIETYDSDRFHTLVVSDDGVGVPEELSEVIFTPLFTTTSGAGPFGPGMGLGLYFVRRLLKRLGGSLDLCEPQEGFSTTFEARFPK